MKSSSHILIGKKNNGFICNETRQVELWVLKQKFRKSSNSEAMLQKSQLVQNVKKKKKKKDNSLSYWVFILYFLVFFISQSMGLPHGPVVKNPSYNTGYKGSIPGWGGSHMLKGN